MDGGGGWAGGLERQTKRRSVDEAEQNDDNGNRENGRSRDERDIKLRVVERDPSSAAEEIRRHHHHYHPSQPVRERTKGDG